MAEYLTVLTTTDAAEKAQALAASAVEAKVAACAQIDGPITSVYRCKGAVQTDQEWRVLYKSSCFRLGTDTDGNGYIAVNGQEDRYLTDSLEALRTLITDIKAGKADHLL